MLKQVIVFRSEKAPFSVLHKPANTQSKQISVAQSGELHNYQEKDQQNSPDFTDTMAATQI